MTEFYRTNYLSEKRGESRHVVLHYHIFKNAGTSVDAILKNCFGDSFMSVDGPVPEFFINQTEVNVMIRNRAQVKALSSHQIRLPVPRDRLIDYLPIVFIRRPELRIQSMWRFQRSRNDEHPATRLAKQLDFAEWIEFHLEKKKSSPIFNQQAVLFSFQYDERTPGNHPEVLGRALANIESLEFVGIVEQFSDSMKIYQRLYGPKVPEFAFESTPRLNRSAEDDSAVDQQIEKIEVSLGADLFSALSDRMHLDIELYERCRASFEDHARELRDDES